MEHSELKDRHGHISGRMNLPKGTNNKNIRFCIFIISFENGKIYTSTEDGACAHVARACSRLVLNQDHIQSGTAVAAEAAMSSLSPCSGSSRCPVSAYNTAHML